MEAMEKDEKLIAADKVVAKANAEAAVNGKGEEILDLEWADEKPMGPARRKG